MTSLDREKLPKTASSFEVSLVEFPPEQPFERPRPSRRKRVIPLTMSK